MSRPPCRGHLPCTVYKICTQVARRQIWKDSPLSLEIALPDIHGRNLTASANLCIGISDAVVHDAFIAVNIRTHGDPDADDGLAIYGNHFSLEHHSGIEQLGIADNIGDIALYVYCRAFRNAGDSPIVFHAEVDTSAHVVGECADGLKGVLFRLCSAPLKLD